MFSTPENRSPFIMPISAQIWDMKYRFKTKTADDYNIHDLTPYDTFSRVAMALAAAEKPVDGDDHEVGNYFRDFYDVLSNMEFLPAGRIVAGAGTSRDTVTLFNCFVMGTIPDDMSGIFHMLREAALTMQQGGGIGYDFSTLRPKGDLVRGVGADASGPLSFMDVWDSMCRTIMSAGHRRGAMMATLRCDHPDIEDYIEAKRTAGRLRMFNMSVLVTDPFMEAVKLDKSWDLVFNGRTYKTISARGLWDRIMQSTYGYAEPGVLFIDRINKNNNLWYAESISSSNPCGEQPLPPYGACLLGSINLAALTINPFSNDATINSDRLNYVVRNAVRMMDNVIDVSNFPLEAQRLEAHNKRRIGLGVTGLADALLMQGLTYGEDDGVEFTDVVMKQVKETAYWESVFLATEKGPFPLFDKDKYMKGEFIRSLSSDLQDAIAEKGIRNSHLTSIAPTGTISLFANNISSGVEPVFAYSYDRTVLMPDGSRKDETVEDYAHKLYREKNPEGELPAYFVNAQTLSPEAHVRMQAAAQRHIDSAISKTINCPENIAFDDFKQVYMLAYDSGCKGCTTYRPNEVTGSILTVEKKKEEKAEVKAETKLARRPEVLPGATYKINWPADEHALYLTINDVVEDGVRRPFEIFLNTKNPEHYSWTVAFTRMVSAIFRRGGDVGFVSEELCAVFDPRGGQWVGGRMMPSLQAVIGQTIGDHLKNTCDFIPPAEVPVIIKADAPQALGKTCPKCSQPTLIKKEGCEQCNSCLYSKCG